ncbi:hypothetical protein Micbo1qcDRAFT_152972 [Microdochium bolleyi]|uniref:Transferase family-domain-containing protein n=1 Tax=Microdochium bolleyi TaxID=196109 RepID=A0A136INC3_9PEZI|nr:hypothetical protein Micbo1qcDRAFT_152972 [Microdochium bolleyi]
MFDAIRRLLGGSDSQGRHGHDGNVVYYPVSIYDEMPAVSDSTPAVLMRFDDVLDATKLRDGLVRLLDIGDWRKLRGRFVRNPATGRVQMHVAVTSANADSDSESQSEAEPITYSHIQYDVSLAEHPLAAQLPVVEQQLQLQRGLGHFAEFCYAAGAPAKMGDYIHTGKPPVSLRVTSFLDATLVSVTWSHVLMDGVAFQRMMESWCLVLAGREDEVRAESYARRQAVAAIPVERYVWADRIITGWKFIVFAVQMVWTMVWQSRVTNRTLVLPAAFMAELRGEAMRALPAGTSFVSDGDIICAWFTRLLVKAHRWSGPVTQLNVVDIRSRVPGVFDPEAVYLQNLTSPALTFLHARDFAQTTAPASSAGGSSTSGVSPLGSIAAQIRSSVAMQTTAAQVRAIFRLAMPGAIKNNRPPVFGEATSRLAIVSNWNKARFILDTDFSPAIVPGSRSKIQNGKEAAAAEGGAPPGRMAYEFTGQVVQTALIRDTAVIVGKDHGGNYWLSLYLAEAVIGAAGQEIARAEQARVRREAQF